MAPVKTSTRPSSAAPATDKPDTTHAAEKPARAAVQYSINIYRAWCKSCGICVEFCPKDVLTGDAFGTPDATAPEKCIGCTLCVLHCPDFAITVSVKD